MKNSQARPRFAVFQFKAQNTIQNLPTLIRNVLTAKGALRILVNHRDECFTFAMPEEDDVSHFERFCAINAQLALIHPDCRAMSYSKSETAYDRWYMKNEFEVRQRWNAKRAEEDTFSDSLKEFSRKLFQEKVI